MTESDHVMARKGDTITISQRDRSYKSLSVAKSLDGKSIELFTTTALSRQPLPLC